MIRNSSLSRFLLRKTTRTFHGTVERLDHPGDLTLEVSNWRAALKKDLATKPPKERETACIYRVPVNMREVERNAYAPNIISIGPYHHGEERLQEMEELKWKFFRRRFGPNRPQGVEIDLVMNALEDLEQDARSCYWDETKQLSKDEFVKMMVIDGCFILELFRELKKSNFHYAPLSRSVKRWMLPALRRDLIMLENQLPLFVLQKLFELTRKAEDSTTSLEDLALGFFNPLLQRDSNSDEWSTYANGIHKRLHFLDLFRLSILPKHLAQADEETGKSTSNAAKLEESNGEETDTMRSMTELIEAGVVVHKSVKRPLFDVRCEEKWLGLKMKLQIPPLYIDDYKGTLFRNMVAYEQCHQNCKPNVTSFLFFFDGLINSAQDVELLHHKGVLYHSLGNNKEVARLVNGLCKEIPRPKATSESCLHKVVADVNSYCKKPHAWIRARLVHHYFSSWVVGVSTIGAIIVLYLTLLQTCYGFIGEDTKKLRESKPEDDTKEFFHDYLVHCLILPISDLHTAFWSELKDDCFEIGKHWMISI